MGWFPLFFQLLCDCHHTHMIMLFQEDDERTIEQDEALITEDERREELAALHNEVDIPIDELLKRYATGTGKIFS